MKLSLDALSLTVELIHVHVNASCRIQTALSKSNSIQAIASMQIRALGSLHQQAYLLGTVKCRRVSVALLPPCSGRHFELLILISSVCEQPCLHCPLVTSCNLCKARVTWHDQVAELRRYIGREILHQADLRHPFIVALKEVSQGCRG